jgi:hypothetical protein
MLINVFAKESFHNTVLSLVNAHMLKIDHGVIRSGICHGPRAFGGSALLGAQRFSLLFFVLNFLFPVSARGPISFPEPAILGKEREALG